MQPMAYATFFDKTLSHLSGVMVRTLATRCVGPGFDPDKPTEIVTS